MSNIQDSIRNAMAMAQVGRIGEAISSLRSLLTTHGNDATLHHSLGLLQFQSGSLEQALFHFDKARHLDDSSSDMHSDYGTALNVSGRAEEAVDAFRRAVELNPRSFPAQLGLSSALIGISDFDGAVEAGRATTEIARERPEGWVNLSLALLRSGRGGEAIATLRESLEVMPEQPLLLCNLCSALNVQGGASPDELFRLHETLGRSLHAAYNAGFRSFNNDPNPDRTLNVAYLSNDFREGPIAGLIEPILANHDKTRFRSFCYSGTAQPDSTTHRLRLLSFLWRDVSRLGEGQIVQQMMADRIDILVDLGGHTPGSRTGVLTMRSAPVQVAWLGYPNTLGMKAVGHRIVDSVVCPDGAEARFTEKLTRLPGSYLCYAPSADAPPIEAATGNDAVTFASFAPIQRLSDPVIDTWAAILRGIPGSRLVLKNASFADDATVRRLRARFDGLGVTGDRVECRPRDGSYTVHLAAYSGIDIALDTFPGAGAATTFEALDMGVPVVTLAGDTFASRAGASILTALGMPELIANSTGDYIRIATELANNPARRGSLRTSLRAQLRNSPLCDGAAFTKKLEAAYRDMWKAWASNLLYM
ncbi:MAG: tetratricopeptide repeat protein [Phycisphaeraceae bacterium]|nr:tetratricopeptide repeat protein [Phycisphaeraceae bacterium]